MVAVALKKGTDDMRKLHLLQVITTANIRISLDNHNTLLDYDRVGTRSSRSLSSGIAITVSQDSARIRHKQYPWPDIAGPEATRVPLHHHQYSERK